MISIEYEQRHVNKQFKKQKIFFCMSTKLGISNATICFKINQYKTIKNSKL